MTASVAMRKPLGLGVLISPSVVLGMASATPALAMLPAAARQRPATAQPIKRWRDRGKLYVQVRTGCQFIDQVNRNNSVHAVFEPGD
jgi:hypothetical protein